MFHSTPPIPTKPKKVIYLIASTFLGLLLSFLVYVFSEIKYLSCFVSDYYPTTIWYLGCVVYPIARPVLFIFGAVGGFFLGKFWWQKVYIEQVWWRNRK